MKQRRRILTSSRQSAFYPISPQILTPILNLKGFSLGPVCCLNTSITNQKFSISSVTNALVHVMSRRRRVSHWSCSTTVSPVPALLANITFADQLMDSREPWMTVMTELARLGQWLLPHIYQTIRSSNLFPHDLSISMPAQDERNLIYC